VQLHVLPAGARILKRVQRAIQRRAEALEQLDPATLKNLKRDLTKLTQLLHEADDKAAFTRSPRCRRAPGRGTASIHVAPTFRHALVLRQFALHEGAEFLGRAQHRFGHQRSEARDAFPAT
jgi:hypothetical protein